MDSAEIDAIDQQLRREMDQMVLEEAYKGPKNEAGEHMQKVLIEQFLEGAEPACAPVDLSTKKCVIIVGGKGTGKDTLADMLHETVRASAYSLKFSQPLKEAAAAIYGWDVMRLDDADYKAEELEFPVWVPYPTTSSLLSPNRVYCKTRRHALQVLGSDLFREADQNVWVREALRRARHESWDFGYAVSTDCRFQNEMDALEEQFGETFVVQLSVAGEERTDVHQSETGIYSLPFDAAYRVKRGDMDRLRMIALHVWEAFLDEFPLDRH